MRSSVTTEGVGHHVISAVRFGLKNGSTGTVSILIERARLLPAGAAGKSTSCRRQIIERDLVMHLEGWLDRKLWARLDAEIERSRELL